MDLVALMNRLITEDIPESTRQLFTWNIDICPFFSLLPTFNIWIDIYFYACIWIFFGTLKKIQFWIQEESNTFLIIEIQLFILFSVYVYGLYQIRFYS